MDSCSNALLHRPLPAKRVTFGDVTVVRIPTARPLCPSLGGSPDLKPRLQLQPPCHGDGNDDRESDELDAAVHEVRFRVEECAVDDAATVAISLGAGACVFCRECDGDMETHCGMKMHLACALWCPEVYYDTESHALANVEAALERCQQIKCAQCRHTGAAIGCVEESCQRSYHLHCALSAGALLNETTFEMRCPKHHPGRKDV